MLKLEFSGLIIIQKLTLITSFPIAMNSINRLTILQEAYANVVNLWPYCLTECGGTEFSPYFRAVDYVLIKMQPKITLVLAWTSKNYNYTET